MKKYTDVDIIAELQKLVDSHVDSYKEDFDIDKRIIRRAAESQNPEDKTLMWFCRPHGTHCLNENQVFIQGTRDHNTFRFYAEQTYDECIARVIVPKAVKRGKVFGDVFEINYREQAANVAQNSVAPDHLFPSILQAEKTGGICSILPIKSCNVFSTISRVICSVG